MTREEAIELLSAYGVPLNEERFQEAIDIAISALSAERHTEELEETFGGKIKFRVPPTEPSDLISRAEVKKLATKFFGHWVVFENRIDNLPSVSAERVGEWTAEIGYDGEILYYECSNCKEAFSLLEGTPEENEYNYCPNCGCRMKGADDV